MNNSTPATIAAKTGPQHDIYARQHGAARDEHQRFDRYLLALSTASEADEPELIGTSMLDQDTAMAQSAILHHLDERAPRLLELLTERFHTWTRGLTEVVDPFPVDRDRAAGCLLR